MLRALAYRWLVSAALCVALVTSWGGQALAATYRVQWGDTLWKLAQWNGTTVDAIKRANGLWSDMIYAGEVIEIPGGPAASGGASSSGSAAAGPAGNASTVFNAAPWEIDLLARLITSEAAGEPYTGQVAVGAVVLNRVRSPLFPSTIADVIYERWQFEPVMNGWINRPATATARQAALDALNGWDPTNGALYFFNWHTVSNSFLWSLSWKATYGAHRFAG